MAKRSNKMGRVMKSKKAKAELTEQAKKSIDAEEINAALSGEPEQADAETAAPVKKQEAPKQAEKAGTGEKKETPKRAAAKKTDAKKKAPAAEKTGKKPGRKPMTAEEKAANAKARAEAQKKAADMVPTMLLQYAGKEIDVSTLAEAARADFKANHKRTPLTELNLYIKPEDGAVYYVANGSVEGKVAF